MFFAISCLHFLRKDNTIQSCDDKQALAGPDILTILAGTLSPRSADIRSGIEAYSRKVPSRESYDRPKGGAG
jgi:hypothetical protein